MKFWMRVFTTPALYTLCVLTNASTAHTMWMPCYPNCTCTWKNASAAWTLTSFNYRYFLSGVPAMFVTVWATVRAVYADTEWVWISHKRVIVTFAVCSSVSLEGRWEPWSGTFIIKCQGCCYSELISKSFVCFFLTFWSFKPLNVSKKNNIF